MRPRDLSTRASTRRARPEVEGLEVRDLPSITLFKFAPASPKPHTTTSTVQPVATSNQAEGARFPNPKVIANSINLLYGPNSATPRTPTAAEVKRETFTAKWTGTYTVGPPRFSDRATTIHFYSKDGGANQFLKGKLQVVLFPPADKNATPNPGDPFANQVTGFAALFDKNYLQSSSLAIFDISGPAASGSDPNALPTHLNWTYDSFASAGAYVAPALEFFQGQGVLDIQYIPDAHPRPGTLGSGRFNIAFQGVLNYAQLFSPVSPVIS
jgi:hypothetical protein